MNDQSKLANQLTIEDLAQNPVWQFVSADERGELLVRPIHRLPVSTLSGKLVGSRATLGNGNQVWALIGNVHEWNPRFTEQFITLSVERDGAWATLSRYFDADYSENGPDALARFLGMATDQVFPISYDLSSYAQGDPSSLTGKILQEPRVKLSYDEIIALAVP